MTDRISTPSKTRAIIESNNFSFKKGYGQNFLIDSNILDNIRDSADVTEDDCVLEIGPGIGSLTQVLAEKARKVVAVEIDKTLIPILNETLKDYDNFTLIHGDILKIDVKSLIDEHNDGKPIKVIANLPYYITTPIIMDLLEKNYPIQSITVMVQKEVADRMESTEKSKDYGALSVAVQYYCDTEIQIIVPPSCFMPPPKVSSSVITLTPLPKRRIEAKSEALFFHVVKCAFGQRRKTLLNCLFNQGNFNFTKDEFTELLQSMGWDERIRGEKLSIEDFGKLSDVLFDKLPTDFVENVLTKENKETKKSNNKK